MTNDVLVDGKHTLLECSNCGTKLIDIWETKTWDVNINVRAKCWKCNDFSYTKLIEKGFYVGDTDESMMKETETLEKYILFTTMAKAKR